MKIMKRLSKLLGKLIILILISGMILGAIGIRYPIAYKDLIIKYSREYRLDPYLVASVINVESKYDRKALSKKDARGLMQIGPQTGQWGSEVLNIPDYSPESLYDPEINIRIGSWYLNTLYKEFNGKEDLVLAAYNAGSGNVNKWLKDENCSPDGENLSNIPFKETENYLIRVEKSYKVYSRVYRKYMMNPSDKDTLYISFIHELRKTFMKLLKDI